MKESIIKREKFWRSAAIIVLCALVYYFSYDHGRKEIEFRLKAVRKQAEADLNLQRDEIIRLKKIIADFNAKEPTNSLPGRDFSDFKPLRLPNAPSGQSGAESSVTNDDQRMKLRVNQSHLLFNGQVIITLLNVENLEKKALLQFNFISDENIIVEEIRAGGAFHFEFNGRKWALALSGLAMSSIKLNLLEIKDETTDL